MTRPLLVCHVGAELGIGHLTRMLAVAAALDRLGDADVEILVHGEPLTRDDLDDVAHEFVSLDADLIATVDGRVSDQVVVLDLHPRLVPEQLPAAVSRWRDRGATVIGVDALLPWCSSLDVTWVPSLLVSSEAVAGCPDGVEYGWDSLLIKPPVARETDPDRSRVLVLAGGSDVTAQHASLPGLLEEALDDDSEVWWVRGPFAAAPHIPETTRLAWTVIDAPSGLDAILPEIDYAISVFGVTLFELIQSGVPTVVFSPYEDREFPELEIVHDEGAAIVAPDAPSAVFELAELVGDIDRAGALSDAGRSLMAVNGAERLARLVHSLAE